jgi:bacterioferritin-associated ferredoxin
MIICSCNIITDHHVRGCLSGDPDCPRTPADVYRALGHRPSCGRCAITIREIVQAHGASPCGDCVLSDLCNGDHVESIALTDALDTAIRMETVVDTTAYALAAE